MKAAFHPNYTPQAVDLPHYPFQKETHWLPLSDETHF
jgi:acyl transferase domain-containing protein